MNAVGDHLWSLQFDPAYMRRYLRVLYQGEFHKFCKPNEAAALVVSEIYHEVLSYWKWRMVKNECEYVKDVHGRFQDSIRQGERLPPVYYCALDALELLLANEVIHWNNFLFQAIAKRPGFRHHWRVSRRDAESVFLQRQTPANTKEAFDKDPLDWCLIQLLGSQEAQTNFDHAMLIAFLQNHLDTSSKEEKARVDEILYQKLSDWQLFMKCLP